MNARMKRRFCLLLVFTLLFAMLPAEAVAVGEKFTYTTADNKKFECTVIEKWNTEYVRAVADASVTKVSKNDFGPDSNGDLIVTDSSNNEYNVAELDLSACTGMTEIDSEAFSECDTLTTVILPASIKVIGSRAFYKCSQLEKAILLGDDIASITIPDDAFSNKDYYNNEQPLGKVIAESGNGSGYYSVMITPEPIVEISADTKTGFRFTEWTGDVTDGTTGNTDSTGKFLKEAEDEYGNKQYDVDPKGSKESVARFRMFPPAVYSELVGNDGIVNVKANYDALSCTVIFDKNGDDATGTMSNQTITAKTPPEDEKNMLNSNGFSRQNYKFTGWNTAQEGNGTDYDKGGNKTVIDNETIEEIVELYPDADADNPDLKGKLTLYAQWQRTILRNITDPDDNYLSGDIVTADDELFAAIPLITSDAERDSGREFKTYLSVGDINNTVSDVHKAAIETKAEGREIAYYLDVDLFRQVDTETPTEIAETNEDKTIKLSLVLEKDHVKENHTYTVYYVDEQVNAKGVTADINTSTGVLTFDAEAFSTTYAIAYAPTPAATATPAATTTPTPAATTTPTPAATSTPTPAATSTPTPVGTSTPEPVPEEMDTPKPTPEPEPMTPPQTGDASAPWIGIALFVAAALLLRRKKNSN